MTRSPARRSGLGPGSLARFSPDSRRAAWTAGSSFANPEPFTKEEVRLIDLTDRSQRSLGPGWADFWLDDGHLVARLPGSGDRVVIDVETGERRSMARSELAPEQPLWLLFRTVDGYAVRRQAGTSNPTGVVRVFDPAGTPVLEFHAYLVRPAGPSELLVATRPRGDLTNIFIVDIPTGRASFIATAKRSLPNWPLAASAGYVAWTEDYCGEPGGRARLFERATGRLIELDRKLWVGMTPGGLLIEGDVDRGSLIDPRTLEYVAVIPGLDPAAYAGSGPTVSWSSDYRYASHGYAGGHGGLC